MRTVDADIVLDKISELSPFCGHCDGYGYVAIKSVQDIINNTPTIEVEPVKRGRWIGTSDGYADGEPVYDMWECSECGYDADGADEKPSWKRCPECGAIMDGERNTLHEKLK